MRKLLLITSVLMAATSAHATQTRGLLTPSSGTQTAQLQVEDQKPSVADQLKAIGEVPKPVVPEPVAASVTAPAPAPVAQSQPATPAAAPAATTTAPAVAAAPAKTPVAEARAEAEPAKKPVKKAKAQRRETDEQKARRIASRYGISW